MGQQDQPNHSFRKRLYYRWPLLYRWYLEDQQAAQLGMETFSAIAHLPGYFTHEEDFRGQTRLIEVVGSLYGLSVPAEILAKAAEQQEQLDQASEEYLQQQPQLRAILKQLEDNYDARTSPDKEEIKLSPEVEKFLRELNGRIDWGVSRKFLYR